MFIYKIIFGFPLDQEYVGNYGDFYLFLKNIGAPKHDLVEVDMRSKKPARKVEVVVAENLDGHGVMKTAFAFSSFILLVYIESSQVSEPYFVQSIKSSIEITFQLSAELNILVLVNNPTH